MDFCSMSIVKEIYKERGIKDCDHELVRKAFEKEEEKVLRKLNITMIIHDTYVKEIDRFHKKQEQERIKREEEEQQKLLEAELAMKREIEAAEEERRKQIAAQKRAKARQNAQMRGRHQVRRTIRDSTQSKFSSQTRDVLGMNSPSKKRRDQNSLRSSSLNVKSIDSRSAAVKSKQNTQKTVGFGSSIPFQSTQQRAGLKEKNN